MFLEADTCYNTCVILLIYKAFEIAIFYSDVGIGLAANTPAVILASRLVLGQ